MAEERVSSVIAESAFKEIEKLKLGLSELSANIVEINKTATGTDLKIASAKSISELSSLSKELGTATEQVKKLTKEQANYQKEIERQAKENEKRLLAIVKQDAAEAKAAEQAAKNAEKRANADEKAAARSAAAKEKAAQRAAEAKEKEAKADAKFQAQLEAMARKNEKLLTDAAAKEEAQIKNLSNDYGILSQAYETAALRAKNYGLQHGINHPLTVQAAADATLMANKLKELDAITGRHTRNVGNYNMVSVQMGQLLRELPAAAMGFNTLLLALSNNLPMFTDALKRAKDEGKSTAEIWKSVGRSFLSLGNIITLVTTLVLVFGDRLFELATQTDNLTKLTNKANDAWAAESVELETLNNEVNNSNTTHRRLLEIRDGFVRQYPKLKENLSGEENLQIKLSNAINLVSEALKDQAIIRAAQELITEETKKMLNSELSAYHLFMAGVKSIFSNPIQALASQSGKSIQESTDKIDMLRAKIEQVQAKLRDSGVQDMFGSSPAAAKAAKEITQELQKQLNLRLATPLDASPDLISPAALSERQEKIKLLQLEEAQRLRMLQAAYAENAITYDEYQEGRQKIADKTTKALLLLQIEELRTQLAGNIAIDNRIKLEQQLADLLKKLRGEEKSAAADVKDEWEETVEILQAYLNALKEVSQFTGALAQGQIQNIRRESEANDKKGEAEIKRIQNSTLTEEEKQEKIRASESKTSALRESLQQKEAQIRQRQAIFEKSIAVMQAIINTAVNVSKLVGNPPAAIAAGIAGAAQVAAIIAQPIPQYATGTLNHMGGKALFGEAGSELVLEPGGNAYMAHKPTVKNLPKGTQVWNQDMLHAMLTPQMVRMLNTKNDVSRDRALFGELKDAIITTGSQTVSAIKRNRAIQRVSISGNDNYYQRRVKGK